MKIREATWEKRNLGVAAFEFFIDTNETPVEVMEEICACDAEYQVLHIASGNTEVLLKAQEEGFRFIEMGIQMELPANKIVSPKIYKRFEPYLSYSIANEDEMEYVLNIVKTGEMFTTDKVSRDPYFGMQNAGIRYAYWLRDVVDNGAVLILAKYKNRVIGFSSGIMDENGTVTAVLGGCFPTDSNMSLGFAPIYLILQWVLDVRGKKVVTNVSSNNLPIIKLHETFGFSVQTLSYILFKHLN